MYLTVLIPFFLQSILITVDEYFFHLQRGLPRWERIGHPLDTLSLLLCYIYIQFVPYNELSFKGFIFLAILSCIMITKDEFIHKHHCKASEQWIHALLFINHPLLLASLGCLWPVIHKAEIPTWLSQWLTHPEILSMIVSLQGLLIGSFMVYQVVYWNYVCH